MVFSSFPAYLDPSNWQQQQQIPNHGGSSSGASTHLTPPPLPPPPGSSGSGSIRPGSMSDRARLANIPMPETALKCPRCESSNTKFCYFNNYSLSQPRHFCKTCRRYWTCGGALRSLPVGGGCRKNKRSSNKGSSSTSSKSTGGDQYGQTTATSSGSVNTISSGDILGLGGPQIKNSPLRFMTPHHNLSEFGNGDQIGLNYGGIPNFNMGNFLTAAGGVGGGTGQWRLQLPQPPPQFSLFGGIMDNSSSSNNNTNLGLVYPNFESGIDHHMTSAYCGGAEAHFRPRLTSISKGITTATTQLASVKMEDNLTRQCLGNDQIQYNWNSGGSTTNPNSTGGAPWTDLSSFSSSSTSNQLSCDEI